MENLSIHFAILAIFLIASQVSQSYGAKCVFYGEPGTTGEQTATGEYFNAMALTCSTLPHIPFGSILQVTNQRNGRSVQVRVNDRLGSSPTEDTIDLTYGAFGLIADHDDGVVPCSYTIVSAYESMSSIKTQTQTLNEGQTETKTVTDVKYNLHLHADTVEIVPNQSDVNNVIEEATTASTTTTTMTSTAVTATERDHLDRKNNPQFSVFHFNYHRLEDQNQDQNQSEIKYEVQTKNEHENQNGGLNQVQNKNEVEYQDQNQNEGKYQDQDQSTNQQEQYLTDNSIDGNDENSQYSSLRYYYF